MIHDYDPELKRREFGYRLNRLEQALTAALAEVSALRRELAVVERLDVRRKTVNPE